jgi:hypothetical protein
MEEELFAGLIGLVVGAAGAWVKAVLAIRGKVNEELRARRLAAYPPVYRLSAALSFWPPAELTGEELLDLNVRLRDWYFTTGGLFLSENSRTRYGELKQLICAHLDEHEDRAAPVPRWAYEDLADTCSAFRTALTEDLETRRQRSLWWVAVMARRHRRQRAAFESRIDKVGGKERAVEAHPLKAMPLSPEQPGGTP